MFATLHNRQLPQYVSDSRAKSTGGGRSITTLKEANILFFTIPFLNKVCQKLPATQSSKVILEAPVTVLTMVSASDPTMCGSTSVPPIPSRPAVSDRSHLRREVVPTACIEAVMQQAAGFS